MAQGLQLPTTYHLMNTLVDAGLLTKDNHRRYVLGGSTAILAQAYLRGRFFWNQRTPGSLQQAIGHFQKAVEHDPGSFGRKAALGVFTSKREEFLTVKTSSPEGAEAVVFKTKKKTAEAMAAKIEFFAKKQAPAPK